MFNGVIVKLLGVVATASCFGYSYTMQEQQKRVLEEINQTFMKANTKWEDATMFHVKTLGVGVTVAAAALVLRYSCVHRRQQRALEEKNRTFVKEKKEWEETKLREKLLSQEKVIPDTEEGRREEIIQLISNDFRHHCGLANQRPGCDCCECVSQKDSIVS